MGKSRANVIYFTNNGNIPNVNTFQMNWGNPNVISLFNFAWFKITYYFDGKSSICIRLRNKNMMYEVTLGHKAHTKQRNVLHVIDI